ncbi:DUF4381 domain-containing protein [Carboxylicivirga sp. M1479]|uniref:DUF4381 domain-containing protein n=1 Tax=Carboxylicivirga sp. M1479 TaxID=2594476 RepID=UPI001177E680|nr:DUF4381 domain-containing protein [Carboxylicivirga sp. M1479]TRX72119.1 DUF4381 domain-containing protein [Carboxylicivirga sp. M1479]
MINSSTTNKIGELMEPAPIPFTLAAPGWISLLLLVLFIIACLLFYKLYQYKKNKYRRIAIKELNALNLEQSPFNKNIYTTVSVLKRVALGAYGRKGAVLDNGTEFMNYLNSKTKTKAFSKDAELFFTKYLYIEDDRKIPLQNLKQFHAESINWINNHHV